MLSFRSIGKPMPLKRHRLTRGKRMYDPSHQDKKNWMKSVKQYHPIKPLESVLELKIIFFFRRPKSHYGTGKNSEILRKNAPKYMNRTPDIDNLVKFYLDAMNGIFFKDDRQIISLISEKRYCDAIPGEKDKPGYVDIYIKDIENPDSKIYTQIDCIKDNSINTQIDDYDFLESETDSDSLTIN